jgi:hypothetical protein
VERVPFVAFAFQSGKGDRRRIILSMAVKPSGDIPPLATSFTDPGQDLDKDALRAEPRAVV